MLLVQPCPKAIGGELETESRKGQGFANIPSSSPLFLGSPACGMGKAWSELALQGKPF